jgi:nucleoside-diphosphate-sugar epimerase
VEAVTEAIPDADIRWVEDPEFTRFVRLLRPVDDRFARDEWGWAPAYDLDEMIEDFIRELRDQDVA